MHMHTLPPPTHPSTRPSPYPPSRRVVCAIRGGWRKGHQFTIAPAFPARLRLPACPIALLLPSVCDQPLELSEVRSAVETLRKQQGAVAAATAMWIANQSEQARVLEDMRRALQVCQRASERETR